MAKLRDRFLQLIDERASSPLPGSLVEEVIDTVAYWTKNPPGEEQLERISAIGRTYTYKRKKPWERVSKLTLGAIFSKHDPLPLAGDEKELPQAIAPIFLMARNRHRPPEISPEDRAQLRRTLVRVHAAHLWAENQKHGVAVGTPEILDANSRQREVVGLVLLQDMDDPIVVDILRKTLAVIVSSKARPPYWKGQRRDELFSNVYSSYFINPPDFLAYRKGQGEINVWKYFVRTLQKRVWGEIERLIPPGPDELSPRTRRRRKLENLPTDSVLPVAGDSRTQVAAKYNVGITTLKRLEKAGVVAPKKIGKYVVYSTEDKRALAEYRKKHSMKK